MEMEMLLISLLQPLIALLVMFSPQLIVFLHKFKVLVTKLACRHSK
jgi:hypothetical protein